MVNSYVPWHIFLFRQNMQTPKAPSLASLSFGMVWHTRALISASVTDIWYEIISPERCIHIEYLSRMTTTCLPSPLFSGNSLQCKCIVHRSFAEVITVSHACITPHACWMARYPMTNGKASSYCWVWGRSSIYVVAFFFFMFEGWMCPICRLFSTYGTIRFISILMSKLRKATRMEKSYQTTLHEVTAAGNILQSSII